MQKQKTSIPSNIDVLFCSLIRCISNRRDFVAALSVQFNFISLTLYLVSSLQNHQFSLPLYRFDTTASRTVYLLISFNRYGIACSKCTPYHMPPFSSYVMRIHSAV